MLRKISDFYRPGITDFGISLARSFLYFNLSTGDSELYKAKSGIPTAGAVGSGVTGGGTTGG
jgi:hypothetical protein